MQLIDLVDAYCTGINSFIVGITMCFVLGYLYGMNKFVQVSFEGNEGPI